MAAAAASANPSLLVGPHPDNPRYFRDATGDPVYLSGWYTMGNLQDVVIDSDGAPIAEPDLFDYDAYLDSLVDHGHNFIRMGVWEDSRWAPEMFDRTGPGTAFDGGLKFDVTSVSTGFIDRLRARVEAAADRDLYVCVLLFQGWSTGTLGHVGQNPYPFHPFHPDNNINGIDATSAGYTPEAGYRMHTLVDPAITAVQEAWVEAVVTALNDLDNVLYEIANESVYDAWPWQYHMVNVVRSREATLAKQHPVGISVCGGPYPEEGWLPPSRLYGSNADWVAPPTGGGYGDFVNALPAAGGGKVVLLDSDHVKEGEGDDFEGNVPWAWKSFARGHNPFVLDIVFVADDPLLEPLYDALGCARAVAAGLDLAWMPPRTSLASTGYCLAKTGAAADAYLVFVPGGGAVWVDLGESAGPMAVDWIDPIDCTVTADSTVTAGAVEVFSSPWAGDAVLRITADPPAPPASPPVLSDDGGPFTGTTTVTITPGDSGGIVRVTTDGAEPTAGSPLYTDPLILVTQTVVRTRGYLDGHPDSDETGATFFRSDEPVGLEFNVGDGFVDIPAVTNIVGSFSVEFWIHPFSVANWNQQIRATGGWNQFLFHTTSSGGIYCGTTVGSRFSPSQLPSGTLVVGQWQHFAITYNGSTGSAVFYRNGSPLAARSMSVPERWTGFRIGARGGSGLDGRIDDVRVYDRPLTPAEVYDHWAGGTGVAAAPEPGLVAGWRLDEGTGTFVGDSSGNGNHGLLLFSGTWAGGIVPTGAAAPPQVAAVSIDPGAGSYTNSVAISLSTATPGTRLFYTIDGTDPDGGSFYYSTPFVLLDTGTVKARAFLDGYDPSPTASAAVIIIDDGSPRGFDGITLE